VMTFLQSIPEFSGRLMSPHAVKERKFEDVVKEVHSHPTAGAKKSVGLTV